MKAFVISLSLLALATPSTAEVFNFMPIACRVLDATVPIPNESIFRFRVTPSGTFGAWQGFASLEPLSGTALPVFQNGSSSCGLPDGIRGVQLSVTIVNPTMAGHVSLWPDGHASPFITQMYTNPGLTITEQVTVEVCQLGSCPYDVSMFLFSGAERIVVDLTGYLTN